MNSINLNKLRNILPKTPGIMRKSDFFNSAVLIPLINLNNEFNFLFEKRAKGIRQEGEVCFPGGEYDDKIDKTFQDAALRETEEELGINKNQVDVIGSLDTLVGTMGVTVDPVIGLIKLNDINSIKFDKSEVEKIFAVPLSFFMNNQPEKYKIKTVAHPHFIDKDGEKIILFPSKELALPERYWEPWNTGIHTTLVYKTNEGVIWGMTARLIFEVINLIKESN
jgi:8-oxo-dGTP pyrophosphatase MutT (NUDIX family)